MLIRIATLSALFLLIAQAALCGGLYQERTTVDTITSYLRPSRIEIDNTYGQIPKMEMVVENITMIPNEPPITRYQHRLALTLDDPTRMIPLYNPVTGEQTGGMISAGEFYAIMYSAFVMAEEATYPTMIPMPPLGEMIIPDPPPEEPLP